jgi:uncharacterized glyoxalase superfamily protein PhnB
VIYFSYTILYVKSVPLAVDFYQKAFGLQQRFIDETEQYAEMETGTTTLAFASTELANSNLPQGFQENSRSSLPAGIEVGFTADDVEAAFAQAIEAGALVVTEPKVKPWGQTVGYVRDLDGILIEIGSRLA